MDLNVLNRVTPIKMERIDSHDLSFCSEADSSYFSLNDWENNGTRGDRGALHPSPGAGSLGLSPVASSPVRKSLFAGVDDGLDRSDGDGNSARRNLNATMQNDEGLQDDSFPNIWKSISIDRNDLSVSDPIFSFTETEGPLDNQISLEVLSTIEDFPTFTNSQSTVATAEVSTLAHQQQSQLPGHNANVAALSQENENTYQCSPSYGNGAIMRSYSNDIPQHNATTLPNLVVSSAQQPGLVQHPNHHGMVSYQSTSPHNNGEGPNSTHSSPYTPSPTGGYEYPTSPPSAKPSIPSNTDYPGDYNFQINFGEATVSAPKSAQYTYSHSLNKLFVKMNVTCPIKFKCDRPAPINCIIRAVPVFKRPEHVTDVATRCPNHKIPDEVNYNLQSSHLIRAEMPNDTQVRYEVAAQDGRESVSVFYERPQVGAEFTTILYKFMCLSSCVGGINRRPLLTVFTLEYDGQVLGRRVVEVRICSCPGRDRSQEEKKQRYTSPHHQNGPDGASKRPFKNLQGTMEILQTVPSNKKRRLTQANGDQEEFTLKIRGREKYEMLKRLKEALDLMDYVGSDQVAAYRRREEEENAKLSSAASTSSGVQPAEQLASTSAQTTGACILTVADPLPPQSAPLLDSQPFSLTPTHSSHPLTVTPTGESYVTHTTQPQGYWEAPGGRDVPESSNVLRPERQPSISSFPSLQSQSLMDTQPLLREASGVSTLSSCSGRQDFGRHVTRITLRQTISLNCDTVGGVRTAPKKNVKVENAPKLDKVVSSDDETWLPAHVKSEVPDDPLTLSQQMEADSAGGMQLF